MGVGVWGGVIGWVDGWAMRVCVCARADARVF